MLQTLQRTTLVLVAVLFLGACTGIETSEPIYPDDALAQPFPDRFAVLLDDVGNPMILRRTGETYEQLGVDGSIVESAQWRVQRTGIGLSFYALSGRDPEEGTWTTYLANLVSPTRMVVHMFDHDEIEAFLTSSGYASDAELATPALAERFFRDAFGADGIRPQSNVADFTVRAIETRKDVQDLLAGAQDNAFARTLRSLAEVWPE